MNKLTQITRLTLVAAIGTLALTSCAGAGDDEVATDPTTTKEQAQTDAASPHTQAHDHDTDGGLPPSGIEEATDPTYAVGDSVILDADHMPGMDNAEATIDSSTDETVYMVDFEMDGMEMTNHKWVVESEIQPGH